MSKRDREPDYATELRNAYDRWDEIFTKGGSDPFWSDGVNLNLVRSHIIGYKEQLAARENTLLGLPDIFYREIPPLVDKDYMVRPDEIRANARKAMERIDADENLKFIREQVSNLTEQQINRWCIYAILGYAKALQIAIDEDDLIAMRRYKNPDRFFESFETAARKIKNPEGEQRINDNFSVCDPENDEEFDCDLDECSDPEQDDFKHDEGIQLTLF